MFKPLRYLAQDQRGDSALTLPILILIISLFLFMGVDILGIYSTHQKLRLAASETLTLMKIDNGWNNDTEAFFTQILNQVGLPGEVTITKYTLGPVNRGQPVELELTTSYDVKFLKPLNQTITVPVKVKLSGLAQDYIR